MKRLIDADVLIGALDAEDGHHAEAHRQMTDWRTAQDTVAICAINLTETLVGPAAQPALLGRAREAIAALGIEVQGVNEAIAVDAARLRQRHPVSLADAYCLATARHTKAALTSFDQKVIRAARAEKLETT